MYTQPQTGWPHRYGGIVRTITTGDITGDSCDDLVIGGSESTFVLNGNGTSIWFNDYQDGLGQLFVGNFGGTTGNEVAGTSWMGVYMLGSTNGSYLSGTTLSSFSTSQIPSRAGDIDGDGRDELVLFNSQGDYTLQAWSASWAPNWQVVFSGAYPSVKELSLGDVNGDGRKEVIFDASNWSVNYTAVVNGSGANILDITLSNPVDIVVSFDVDGDGLDEILLGSVSGRDVKAYKGNGTQLWAVELDGSATLQWVLGAQLDSDAPFETVVAYKLGNTGYVSAFDNGTEGSPGAVLWTQNASEGDSIIKIIAGDLNKAGKDEIVYSSGNLSYGFFGVREGGSKMVSAVSSNGTLLWERALLSSVVESYFIDGLAIADVNCDGLNEVAAGLMDVYLLNQNGTLLWTYYNGLPVENLALGDLDGDGKKDVVSVVSEYQYGTVQAYAGNGTQLWQDLFPYVKYAKLIDLDQDGKDEVIAAGTHLRAYDHNGTLLWNKVNGNPYALWVGDLTGNQTPEILTGLWGNITAFDANGSLLWYYDTGAGTDMTYVNSIKVGDVNGDEKKEVIAGAMYLMALNETGSLIWKRGYEEYDFIPDYTDYNTVSLGDLDNDGVLDIVIGTGSSKHLKAYYGNGSIMWRRNDTKYPIRSTDIDDIDGDGRNEVLAVQNFYNSSSYEDMGVVGVYEHDGGIKFERNLEENAYHAAYFEDVTGDGVPDILASQYKVYRLGSSDGAVLWTQDLGWFMVSSGGGDTSPFEVGDLDLNEVPDVVMGGLGVYTKEDPSVVPGTTTTTSSTTTSTTSTTTTTTTSSTTTSTTTTVYVVSTQENLSFASNNPQDLNVSEINLTLKVTTTNNVSNVTITVVSRSENPTNASFSVPSVGRYLEINTSETLKSNLAWVYFTLEYSQSDVDELSLNESTLGFYWFNTSNSEWQRLNSSNSWMASWVYGSGVDTTQNFVWTNVSHFSAYTIGGSTLSERLDIPLIIGWNLFSLPLNVL